MPLRLTPQRARLALTALEGRCVPANFTVTNTADSGPGSLRQTIFNASANGGADTIDFAASVTGTITLTSGELLITDDVTITGPGAGVLSVSGGNTSRVFKIANAAQLLNVNLTGLTVTGGRATGPDVASNGGGIFVEDENVTLDRMRITGNVANNSGAGIAVRLTSTAGRLAIRNTTISGNTATGVGGALVIDNGGGLQIENSTISGNSCLLGDGGGLYIRGQVTPFNIVNSTFAGNSANRSGGAFAVRNFAGMIALVRNCTITANTSSEGPPLVTGSGGGGISTTNGFLRLESTIVSGNTAANGNSDIAAGYMDASFCAIGDPDGFTLGVGSVSNLPFGTPLGLGTLANNGGPTQTVAFGDDSPLCNAGTNPAGLSTDQRGLGFPRTFGGGTDIGAFEVQTVGTAPRVVSVEVNFGQTNQAQRSRVTSLTVTFDAQVTFAGTVAAAFGLSRIGGGQVGGFNTTVAVVNGATVVTLSSFSGAETESGSLADGRFAVLVRAGQVRFGNAFLDGNGDGTGGDDYVLNGTAANGLYRLFGDVNGDAVVNAFDFAQFRSTFGLSLGNPGYLDFLDINGDGSVNAFDFGQFRTRFGAMVP